MGRQEINRFRRRAEEERQQAGATRDPRLAKACRELADKYEAVAQAYEKLGS